MIIVKKIDQLKKIIKSKFKGKTIGFVPTLGDLHNGHLSLISRSKKENKITIVSIFINPTQFNQKSDYMKYRRNEKQDKKLLNKAGVDLVFIPDAKELYSQNFQTWITVQGLSKNLCGKYRPGHFKAVATIVIKFLNLIRPDRSYFGMKDFQQLKVIQQAVMDLNIPTQIIPCETVRETNGLAISSRNIRLKPQDWIRAGGIFHALQSISDMIKYSNRKKEKIFRKVSSKERSDRNYYYRHFKKCIKLSSNDRIEYFELVDPNTLSPKKKIQPPVLVAVAVWIGTTRLIDNILIK